MTISTYVPTFRNVLLEVVELTQTKGGIYIPSTVFVGEKEYKVLKTGKDCTEIKVGDLIKIMANIRTEEVTLDNKTYIQLPEQQIIGYERPDNDSIRTTPKRKPKATTSS